MQAELHFDAHQLPVNLLKRGPLPAVQAGGRALSTDGLQEQQQQRQHARDVHCCATSAASLWVLVPAALCQAAVGLRAVLLKLEAQGAVCGTGTARGV